ncbi:MAG: hypothetical protein JSS45_08400 [Proteobacteria bacterium]|nr:hypothetical protein [Pseudomonadota bacterium]MBS0598855.1 hypothetical protein [Pseudomonadota bacterium]
MRLRARRRFRIAVLAIMCLLFQQFALAAYACALDRMPPDPSAMASTCASMGMQHDNPVLCAKHCAPDVSVAAHMASPSVPPLALPPMDFGLVAIAPAAGGGVPETVPLDRSDPPPRLRYCSLLI